MDRNLNFALVREMNEVPALLRNFDPSVTAPWLAKMQAGQKILLTGEGSSRIFPAKSLMARAMREAAPWTFQTEGARQAAEYDLSDYMVLGASNSGQTRELIDLMTGLDKAIPCLGLTATAGSRLTEVAQHSIILSSGKEQAVAATKTVVEQALVYQSLLQGNEWQHQAQAADYCAAILQQDIPDDIVAMLAAAETVYFAGRNDGVAEELSLKTNEIARKKSQFLEGTYVVHGIEEVMQPDEVVILIEPYAVELEKIRQVIQDGVGMKIIAIASEETIFPTIRIPKLQGFDIYFQLMAGWNILVAMAQKNGINMDKPERARKVGNSV